MAATGRPTDWLAYEWAKGQEAFLNLDNTLEAHFTPQAPAGGPLLTITTAMPGTDGRPHQLHLYGDAALQVLAALRRRVAPSGQPHPGDEPRRAGADSGMREQQEWGLPDPELLAP